LLAKDDPTCLVPGQAGLVPLRPTTGLENFGWLRAGDITNPPTAMPAVKLSWPFQGVFQGGFQALDVRRESVGS